MGRKCGIKFLVWKKRGKIKRIKGEHERILEYIFTEKLKLVFEKMLAIFDLRDPLVQIHLLRLRLGLGNEGAQQEPETEPEPETR